MHRRTRPAFTLIELLTVIAIMGILMALLLPAVMKIRAAAAKTQCMNNLKQIGLAIHHYNSDRGYLPAGFKSSALTTNGASTGPGWGWGAYLLPYLEQDTLYNRLDLRKAINDIVPDLNGDTNFALVGTSIKVFQCPSDNPVNPKFWVYDGAAPPNALVEVGFSNYVAMSGIHEVTSYPDTGFPDTPLGSGTYILPNPDPRGVFLRSAKDRGIKINDITDGTGSTLLVTERAWLWQGKERSPYTTWVGAVPGAVIPAPTDPSGVGETAGTLVPEAAMVLTNSGTAADSRFPNSRSGWHAEDANSNHTAGVNGLFGDGSVRSIPNTIDIAVWLGITTRAGRVAVDIDF